MSFRAAERLEEVGEYWFSRKLEQVRALQARGADVINLGIGSPDLAPPPAALDAAAQALRDPRAHGYAPYRGTPELRRAMAEFYARTYHVRPDPEREVLPLLGSKEGILYLSLALLNPGDAVLIPDPGYPAYASVAAIAGARAIPYRLREERGWQPDLDAIEREDLSRVRLMWVNYPHMPTGARAGEGLFARLAEFGRRHGIVVCNDNPYGLVLNEEPPTSLLAAHRTDGPAGAGPGARDPWCCELNSLSKSFSMAGWRVGMLLGAPALVEAVLKVKSNADSGMFLPVQAGAVAALAAPDAWHAERNAVYAARRTTVRKIFDALGFAVAPDQVGLFLWARAPGSLASVEELADDLLEQAQVFLTPGFIFGEGGRRYARSSLCVPPPRLDEALRRVEAFALHRCCAEGNCK